MSTEWDNESSEGTRRTVDVESVENDTSLTARHLLLLAKRERGSSKLVNVAPNQLAQNTFGLGIINDI